MPGEGSVTHWINETKRGNRDAVQVLWERYYSQMVRLAQARMLASRQRVEDAEDVAISVFARFCQAAEQGRFPDLSDRNSLWRLLVRMTAHKVIDQQRRQCRQRRGGGEVRGESAFANADGADTGGALAEVIGLDPDPQFVVMMSEEVKRLLDCLGDESLRELVTAKLEGFTNAELASRMNCSERTIERRLRLIRAKWSAGVSE